MGIKISSIAADLKRENDGDYVEIPPDIIGGGEGILLKVRAFSYAPYLKERNEIVRKWHRAYGRDQVPLDVAFKADGRLYAKHILLDWKGLDEDDGSPMKFSIERAEELMTNMEFRLLQDAVQYAAGKIMVIAAEETKAELKN
jgi:hypothetical protein